MVRNETFKKKQIAVEKKDCQIEALSLIIDYFCVILQFKNYPKYDRFRMEI